MKKLFSILLLTLSLCHIVTTQVRAASEFSTRFTSHYTINNKGATQVKHTIELTNNLAYIYATDYTIATSGENLEHVTASDDYGALTTTITKQNGVSTIHLAIPHPTIGLGQTKVLNLSYQTDDVVEVIGDTMTINIPRLARANEAESYTRIVEVEGVSERPHIIYPPVSSQEPNGDYAKFTFQGHANDSLTLLFGDSVTYKLDLTYELKNKELYSADSELALPPDTPYQKILLNSITPPPKSIELDESGNWLARYSLKSQEKVVVSAELYATIYPLPTQYDPSSKSFQSTPRSEYWELRSDKARDLATQLKTPQNIYTYLTTNFTYNYGGITSDATRQGATAALDSPSGVLCTEFTDTFIALARANKIASREINGYGYTKNSLLQPQNEGTDILHAWPEYYDEGRESWISVDPTWGNTTGGIDYFNKLDFSHITFVRRGAEDSYPLPAGAYKSNPSEKHIQVTVAPLPLALPHYQVETNGGKTIIVNDGKVALVNQVVTLADGRSITVKYLPPYASYRVEDESGGNLWSRFTHWLDQLARRLSIRVE